MGRLIAIEGTDGSGKATQTKALTEYFTTQGLRVAEMSFPRYGMESAKHIEQYLNNDFGDAASVDPYLTSIFYAIDRRESKEEIRDLVGSHDVVFLDRYVDSNAGHQGSKITDADERAAYLDWLYRTEYDVFDVPRPDLVLVLHVPSEISSDLISNKKKRSYIRSNKTHDAHEGNMDHLKAAEETYLWLSRTHTDTHRVITCTDDAGNIFTPEEITKIMSGHILREFPPLANH